MWPWQSASEWCSPGEAAPSGCFARPGREPSLRSLAGTFSRSHKRRSGALEGWSSSLLMPSLYQWRASGWCFLSELVPLLAESDACVFSPLDGRVGNGGRGSAPQPRKRIDPALSDPHGPLRSSARSRNGLGTVNTVPGTSSAIPRLFVRHTSMRATGQQPPPTPLGKGHPQSTARQSFAQVPC
jgi:hypothetical protein